MGVIVLTNERECCEMDKNYVLSLPSANEFNACLKAALANNEISKDDWI